MKIRTLFTNRITSETFVIDTPMEERDINYSSSDGLDLFAKQWGSDDAPQTVLCLHGLTRNHKDFIPMVRSVGGNQRFIAWDTRGRGRSARDPMPERYRLDVYAQDALALIEHLKLENITIIGTSMGGLISMVLMSLIPDKIDRVVLNDIGPRLEPGGVERIAGYVGEFQAYPSFEAAGVAIADVQGSAFPNFSEKDWLAFAQRTFVETQNGVELDYDPAIAESLKNIPTQPDSETETWALFEKMSARPLLIVRGGISDLLSSETTGKMVARHASAKEVVVPDVGHAPILDEPPAVEALKAFLNSM